MASLKELKAQIEDANALGVANLTDKGVDVPATATTYDIMSAIAEIVSGGGASYTSIIFEEDDKITLIDKDGTEHTMEWEYTDGKITTLKYDGKAIPLTYDVDELIKIGITDIVKRVEDYGVQVEAVYEKILADDAGTYFRTVDDLRASYPELIIFYNTETSKTCCLIDYTQGQGNIGAFDYTGKFTSVSPAFAISGVYSNGSTLKDILNSIITSENKFTFYSSTVTASGYTRMYINCESDRINYIDRKPSDLAIIEFKG
jgi:hypothetical protein